MSIASTYSASASLVLNGTKFDHVTESSLSTTGTVTETSDGDGNYLTVAAQPGNRLTAGALNRATKAGGATWIFKIKTTATGPVAISGEIDTGTNYLEALVINQNSTAGDTLNGSVGIYIRQNSSSLRFARSPNVNINDGNLHTVIIEWSKTTTTFQIYVDGVAQTVTYDNGSSDGNPQPSAGAMNFPLTVFERNVRNSSYDLGLVGKLYFYARLLDSGFNLSSLSSDPHQIVASGGETISCTPGNTVAAGLAATILASTLIASNIGDAVAAGATATIQAGSNVTISATPGNAVAAGSQATITASGTGTLTTEPLKNNTGTLLNNLTGATAFVYNTSTGALVVAKTGQTTDASGIMTITDALIAPATQYRVVVVLGTGAEGLAKITAS